MQRVIVTDDRRQAAEELAARWPQLTAVIFEPYVDALAPVVAALSGT